MNVLKQDLDSLQAKLAEAASAIRLGSEQLVAKEFEASAFRSQLENVLASVQEKENENRLLQETLNALEQDICELVARTMDNSQDRSVLLPSLNDEKPSLQTFIKLLVESHQSEVESLKKEAAKTSAQLQKAENTLDAGETSHQENCQKIDLLQEMVECLQAELHAESEKVKEAGLKLSLLHSELKSKDDQINFMNIQASQQKELLAGLTQQLKEKKALIAQVLESASNERMKFEEKNRVLMAEFESMDQENKAATKKIEEISQQLDENTTRCQREIETKNLETDDLIKEVDHLKSKVASESKEKDALKKKLQATLIVRKQLLGKIEEYEKQKAEFLQSETEVSALKDKLQEVTFQSEATASMNKEKILDLEKKMGEKEEHILKHKREIEHLVEKIQTEKEILQSALNEKEALLSETLRTLDAKNSLIEHLQCSFSEKADAFEQDRKCMMQKLEELQNEIKKSQDDLKDKDSSSVAVENELAQLKLDQAMLQKKTRAALLARKETMKKAQEQENKLMKELAELKDDYNALLEQHCQQPNQLNNVQLNFDKKVQELDNLQKMFLCNLDELDTLRQLVSEKDKTLQDLKVSLAEKESQCRTLPSLEADLVSVKSKHEQLSVEMAGKDESASIMQLKVEALNEKIAMIESDLAQARADVKDKTEELDKYQETVKAAELKVQQEKLALTDEILVLKNQLSICQSESEEQKQALNTHICSHEQKYQLLMEEKKALLEQSHQLKADLQAAVDSVSQKSLEVLTVQKTLSEKLQRLSEERDVLTEDLEKAKLLCTEKQSNIESMKQEKENAFRVTGELKDKVTALSSHLKEAKKQNEQLHKKDKKYAETYEVKLKERDGALLLSQAQLLEKEGIITALELQLQQQIKMHQLAIDKVRTEVDELQKSRQDDTKSNDQDDQGKVAVLTRKLQAALISRKELFKENATLKEQVQKLSTQHEAKEAQRLSVEASLSELKEQKLDLESHVFSLNKEKEMLSTEVDRILNENRSLSAACESLKLTIENITQQKQAFSCQLESLKDSQAEELSKWKSKHSELKQEYESLLQGYENVSSEMDKMRQLLEGAKRERQDALKKVHRHETEAEILGNQTRELEAEKKRMEAKLEALEDVNHTMRRELSEVDGSHETVIRDLTVKNQQLEAQVSDLKELSDKLTEVQAENINLTKKLEEASSYEQMHIKSKSCVHDMQLKLNEALTLNNSLTAQFEAQKTELGAQFETNNLLQREKQSLSERIEMIQNDHELQLGFKECVIKDLQDIINRNSQETISLNEKVRILEDDKTLLQEELENVQEISDKVKNENEYLETVILKNSERIDELTESVTVLQNQNAQLSSQLSASDGKINQVLQEKETEQLRLVREFEDKLKTFQRGNEGSKNVKKGLQELLKEKHHEIKQLQQNSINYQEVIWDLENNLKSSKSTCKHLEQELKKHSEKILILEERSEQVEAELSKHKSLLLEANKTVVRVQFERDQVAQEMLQQNNMSNCEVVERTKSPQKTNEKQMESQILLQQQLEDLQKLKEQESQKVTELRQHIDAQDVQINMLKRAAETNEAKLSALASTPHGADSLRHWNELYQKSLHEKDSQLLEQGFVIKRFLEDMRVKEKEVNELRMTKSRLERTLNEYSVAAAAQQRQAFVTSASNAELTEIVELMTVQVKELSSRVERLEQEKSALNRQLADKEDVMSDVQLNVQHMEKMNADLDAQLVLLQSQNDKVQADLEKQEGISLQLKTLLQSKDAEISSLLSCKDGQMSGFIEQLQANYRTQVAVYEDRLSSLRYQKERVDKEFRGLETKVRNLQTKVDKSIQERKQMEARMESFRNSVVSLQSEQEQLMSENRILNAKNQLVLKGKDDSADREVGTAKGFKHEIRKLLHQMDDLNSENAMLRAQLVRYREDLNQVLSLKDNQLKGLLKKQQDMIKNLENQKTAAEKQHRECRLDLQKEEETNHIFKTEKYKLQAQVQKLQSEIEAQKKENATTNEGRVIADLQQAVEAKAAQCNDLQQKLLSQKFLTGEQKGKIKQLENEMDKKLTDAEDKFNSELDSFEQEVELMRNQREMADQRLAELTNNLLQTEQQLLEAKAQNKDTRAQNESLCKAMAALQNNRDQLIEDFKVLQSRYDEELRETQSSLTKVERSLQDATSNLAMFAKEKDILVQKMKALESNEAHSELSKLLDEVSKALSQKERELKQVALENDTYKRQLSAFSRSMASLQNDRDRLVDELAETKSVVESRQQTSSGSVTSVIVEKSKDDFTSIFRNEKEGLNNRQMSDYLQKMEQRMQTSTPQHEKEVGRSQEEITDFRQQNEFQTAKEPTDKKEAQLLKQEAGALAGRGRSEEVVSRLETERIQLHRDLQRCMYEIQQRDQYFQQLNVKLQQVMEEKGVVAAQLRAVSETLRNTQNHCHWLENQGQAQGALFAEDAPGAPQERSSLSITMETDEASQLRERLVEVEQSLSEERSRREMAEEALRLLEDRTKSVGTSVSRDRPNDFSIHLEAEEEWEALSLNPNQPLISRKVKGGMAACRQWLRGRSLYFSKLLMSRGRARYLFLAYLLTLHVLVFMCLSGAL
ncbi:golgin subfamily B member 1 isoform X2 [Thalassophryne amazonica]|uniref:golgin subfamily B member 1 isoform X2 n=1 Tax=Thalassophryne amazonica TaxID=390379 RepID=UPI001470B001|nr:golgin subfamily B member 1 isoform X2 [Thalassophryne amazonica]